AMLTGDSMTGTEAVEYGWANAAYPVDELDEKVLAVASKIAKIPTDIAQINKRVVHRQMEVMGLRTGIRVGTELCALGTRQASLRAFVADAQGGLKEALTK